MAEWNDNRPKGRWDPEHKSDAEDRATQRGIDATMRDVIKDRYNPHSFGSMADDPPKRGTGWVEPRGLESPAGQDHIERLANSFQPHGLGNSAHPLAKVVEEALAKLKAQQAEKGEKSGES
jgi:hypothetical protein